MNYRCSLPCLLALSTRASGAQVQFLRDFAPIGSQAVGLLPPEIVCGPTVQRVIWSQDGKLLLAIRIATDPDRDFLHGLARGKIDGPIPKGELVVWDMDRGKAETVFTYNPATTTINKCDWLAGTSEFIASMKLREDGLTQQVIEAFHAGGGAAAVLYKAPESQSAMFSVAPDKPQATIARVAGDAKQGEILMYTVDADGQLGSPSHLSVARTGAIMMGFNKDGDGPFAYVDTATGQQRYRYQPGKEMTLDLAELEIPQSGANLNQPSELGFTTEPISTPTTVLDKKAVWLSVGKRSPARILVTADGTQPSMAPFGTGVAYLESGRLSVRRLVTVSFALYDEQARLEDKNRATAACEAFASKLSDVVISLNRRYPTPDQWQALAKQAGYHFDGPPFVYTYDGTPITKDNRSTIALGYCKVKLGTATLHADWKVEWVPAP